MITIQWHLVVKIFLKKEGNGRVQRKSIRRLYSHKVAAMVNFKWAHAWKTRKHHHPVPVFKRSIPVSIRNVIDIQTYRAFHPYEKLGPMPPPSVISSPTGPPTNTEAHLRSRKRKIPKENRF